MILRPIRRGYKQRRWTEDDDEIIRSMLENGKTYDNICAAFNPPAARGTIIYRVERMAKLGKCPTPKRMI